MSAMKMFASLMVALWIGVSASAQVTIESSRGGDPRIPIAVPDFAAAPGSEALAQEMAATIAFDLDFSCVFRLVTPDKYPAGFTGFTRDPNQIDFAAWRAAGVAFLAHGYVSSGEPGTMEVRLFDVDSVQQVLGKQRPLSSGQKRYIAHLFSDDIVFQVDGVPGIATSQIAFSGGTTGNKELYLADYDGMNVHQLTQYNSISILPKLSPDGSKVAYVSFRQNSPITYIEEVASGRTTTLSKRAGLNMSAAWAPNGQYLAMTLSKDANPEIYLINPDGTGLRRVTNDRAVDTQPSFSPDGNQIAFVSDRFGSAQVCIMPVNGGSARRVSMQGGRSMDPAWSPDGKLIAYAAENGGTQIWVVDPSGGTPERLTNSGGTNEKPTWSADSRHVMFSSTRDGSAKLYAVNVKTKIEHRIPNLRMACQGPSWGPRRGQ